MVKEHRCKFYVPEKYCGDNGVMIALLGLLMHRAGIKMSMDDTKVRQRYRTDDVEVLW